MDINEARRVISEMDSHKIIWDDNLRARANNAIDAADPVKQADKIMKAQRAAQLEAVKPAINSYNAQKGEISQKYAQTRTQLQGQEQPLKDRYTQLLSDVKGNQQVAENRQTLTTNNELAKRGLTSSSGVAQQEMTNALNPITREYTSIYNQTGLEQEAALKALRDSVANLTTQETSDQRAIENAIASLYGNAATSGGQIGASLFANVMQNQLAQAQLEEQKRQANLQDALGRANLEFQKTQGSNPYNNFIKLGEGDTLFDLAKLQKITNIPKTYKADSGGGNAWY